jgi:hypothetical protein
MWLNKEGWQDPGAVGLSARSAPVREVISREALAKEITEKLNAEFDRVVRSIQEGSSKFRGLDPGEIARLLAILEEKRAAVFAEQSASGFTERLIEQWQHGMHRVQTMFGADDRVKAICEARAARRRVPEPGPVRYLGFDDGGGHRTYKFARLPPADDAKTYAVRVPQTLLAEHNLSLQDGPAFCVAIMAANPEPADYTATEEDAKRFLATLPVKAARKPWKRPRPAETVPNGTV